MYNLVEKDKFERLKVNGLLPDHVVAKTDSAMMISHEDCTKQFSEMLESYRDNMVDTRDHPDVQDQVPMPLD